MCGTHLGAEGYVRVSRGTIIIVDDRDDVRNLVARVARREGYDVHDTADPGEFVRLVSDRKPDLVAIDVVMPDKDGVEVIGELAQVGFAGKLMIMSGYNGEFLTQTSRLAKAHGLDVVGVLPKPIVIDDLRAMMRQVESVGSE